MNKDLKIHIIGFFIISIIGTLVHFTYELSNYTYIIGLFSAVNESIFEHLKLIVFGIVIFMLYEHILYKDDNRYIFSKVIAIISGAMTILIIYYTYTFFTKESIVIVDIMLFYLSVLISQISSYMILSGKIFRSISNNNIVVKHSKYLFVFIILIFFFFTFYPPKLGMFKDPKTGTYGILRLE